MEQKCISNVQEGKNSEEYGNVHIIRDTMNGYVLG